MTLNITRRDEYWMDVKITSKYARDVCVCEKKNIFYCKYMYQVTYKGNKKRRFE